MMARRPAAQAALALLLIFGYASVLALYIFRSEPPHDITTAPVQPSTWADSVLKTLTTEQKVAQILMLRLSFGPQGASNPELDVLNEVFQRIPVGGVLLSDSDQNPFERSITRPNGRTALSYSLVRRLDYRRYAEKGPLFLPDPLALAAASDTSLAYAAGSVLGRMARGSGAQQVLLPRRFFPSPDVSTSTDSVDEQTTMLYHFLKGIRRERILPILAFDEGAGVSAGGRVLERSELSNLGGAPWLLRQATEPGDVGLFLRAKSLTASRDAWWPSNRSRTTGAILRSEYGFNGLIVASLDDDETADASDVAASAIEALQNGADAIELPLAHLPVYGFILEAVRNGKVSRQRLDEAVLRMLRVREWSRTTDAERGMPLPLQREVLDRSIAQESVTLLRNAGIIPYQGSPDSLVCIILERPGDPASGALLEELFTEYAGPSQIVRIGAGDVNVNRLTERLARGEKTAAGVFIGDFAPAWAGSTGQSLRNRRDVLLESLKGKGIPVAYASFGLPENGYTVERVDGYLQAYDQGPAVQRAVFHAFLGMQAIRGKLFLNLAGSPRYGDGLRTEQIRPRKGLPEEVGMIGYALAPIDSLIRAEIADHTFPGAAVAIGRDGVLTKLQGYGRFTYGPSPPTRTDAVFDIASLTKVVVTTTAAMILYDQGSLILDAAVGRYLPQFNRDGKERITIRQLLEHSSGLPAYRAYHEQGLRTSQEVLEAILSEPLEYTPGADHRYSDLGMIVLGVVIERISGEHLDAFARRHIFEPLEMRDTGFRPVNVGPDTTIVPTEVDRVFRKRLLQGEVHDETAYLLGGVAGHAGLFSTAEDLARFCYMYLNGGKAGGRQILQPETIRLFTRANPGTSRALGWDTKSTSGYSAIGQFGSSASYGHTGFTGTSLWIDPMARVFIIFLANRVYPDRSNDSHREVRARLADLVFTAIAGPPRPLLPFSLPARAGTKESP